MIRSNRSARERFIRAAQRKMDINESRSGRRFLTKAEARRIFNRVKEDVEECDAQKEDDEADTTEVSESRRRLAARRRLEAYRRRRAARRAALKEDDEEVPADDSGDVDADAAADTDIDAGGDAPVDDASADTDSAPTIQDMVNNISVQLNDIKQTLGMTVESDLGPDADTDVGDALPESKRSVLCGARRRLEARRRSMLRNRRLVKEGIAFADDISHRADGFAMSTKKGYSKTIANGSLGKKAPEPKISDNELANGTEKNVVRWGKDATDLDTKKPYAKANVDTDAEIDKYISSLKGQKQVESILKSFSRS